MARHIREHDWTATPFGPIEGWSGRLRLMVEQVLANPCISALVCGPSLLLLYNDAAARLYGPHHPAALGRPLPQTFPQGWATVAPFYERAFGGESVQVEAQPLDTRGEGDPAADVFDAVLLPVREENGHVAYVHMTGIETGGRSRTEQTLRENEARLAAVFESLPIGIGVMSRDGALVLSNPAMHRFLPTGIIPSRDPERRARWRALYLDGQPAEPRDFPGARALRGERVVPGIEMLYQDDDGQDIWTSVSSAPIRNVEGQVTGGVVVVADTDKARRTAEALRESEERFRGFAENSADTIWIADQCRERLEYLSPAFERMFGVPRDAVMADVLRWRDLVHPDDHDVATDFIRRAIAGETAMAHYRAVHPSDGQLVHLHDTCFPIRDRNGHISRVAGIVQDVSDIVRVGEGLEAEKERFRIVVEGIPQMTWRSLDRGRWTWASPQWRSYTGQSQGECRGLGWLDVLHPDDRQQVLEAWAGAGPHGQLDVEYRVRRASDGAWRWHQTRSLPVRSAPRPGQTEGHILEWLGTSTDIEDLKQLQAEQAVLLAELQHRTRNLVTVIRNIAKRSFGSSPERDTYDERLAAIGRVQGFLARSGSWSVPLHDLVRTELEAAGDGHSDRVTVQGPAVELPGDKAQTMALALHELATNAAKYGAIAQDSAQLRVTWKVEEGGTAEARLVLEWHESGVAMPAEPPSWRGYGSELIERTLPYQLKAQTHRAFAPDGLRCTIALPVDAFQLRGGSP